MWKYSPGNGNVTADYLAQQTVSGAPESPYGGGIYRNRIKRGTDVVLAMVILTILAPLIVILLVMAARDGGPPLFGHERIGRSGRRFRCWKIRTMVPDAQGRLNAYLAANPAAALEWERSRKLRNDPRITRFGAFLRQTSLDELPQLWNVIVGDMSLVGPRPVTEDELGNYGEFSRLYLRTRPGVTGLWQVSGRNDITYDLRVALDVQYARSLSLIMDAMILARTVVVVLRRTGC